MNVLAEAQKKILDKSLSKEELELRTKEFLELYFKLRNEDENKWWSKLTLEQRRKLHSFVLMVYTIKNRIGRFSYEIIKDERTDTNRPKIFVITHVGKFDIEVISEAIKEHYYLLSGDFEHIQGIIDAPFLGLNGVFYFNEKVKEDRKLVSEKMINHLQDNGNIMYFIEGTWNLSRNLPVLPCYWGIVDIAKSGNAIIVPVAAEQYGKHFKINVGANFDLNEIKDKSEAINTLRDVLATLKWEIWETETIKRDELDPNYWAEYIEARFKEWPYFYKEYIYDLIFKPKNIITPEDVYKDLSELSIDKDNLTPMEFANRMLAINDARKRVKIHNNYYF